MNEIADKERFERLVDRVLAYRPKKSAKKREKKRKAKRAPKKLKD